MHDTKPSTGYTLTIPRVILVSWPIYLLCIAGCEMESTILKSPAESSLSDTIDRELQRRFRFDPESRFFVSGSQQVEPIPLRIITYNVHLLPKIAQGVAGRRSDSNYRAKAIAEQLAKYDIVGINEAFEKDQSRVLIEGLQSSSNRYQVAKGPVRSGRHFVGSGLVLMSRYPIEVTHTVTFEKASRFVTSGFKADGFAAKGALHARIRLSDEPGASLDCFLTHMESRSTAAREHQIGQFAKFVASHSTDGYPVLMLGDFNVEADALGSMPSKDQPTQYARLRQALYREDRRLVDVWRHHDSGRGGTSDALAEDGGSRIDYIFVSNGADSTHGNLVPKRAVTLPFLDKRVKEASLSDHLALACTAEFCMPEPVHNRPALVR